MSFHSALSWVGHEAGAIFSWVGSAKGQATIAAVEGGAVAVVGAINPAAGAALLGIESVINVGLKGVVTTEALAVAAGQQAGTGPQKTVAVATSLSSEVSALLQSLGDKQPNADKVQSIAQIIATSLANIVNAFPAPAGK